MNGPASVLTCALLLLHGPQPSTPSIQTVTVTGQLLCDGGELAHHELLLRERDALPFDEDDTLAATDTDDEGHFNFTGSENEIFDIEPYISVVHQCGVKNTQECHRITDFYVPRESVRIGQHDFGSIELRPIGKKKRDDAGNTMKQGGMQFPENHYSESSFVLKDFVCYPTLT